MGALDQILPALRGVKSRGHGRYMAHCPAHQDRVASLSISEGADGRVLLRCFAGCEVSDVLAAAGKDLADLFPSALDHRLRPLATARLLNATDALRLLRQEAALVAVCASDLARGQVLSDETKSRLMLACGRAAMIAQEAGL